MSAKAPSGASRTSRAMLNLGRVNAVIGRVPKSAQLAGQFFQKQPHLAVEHRVRYVTAA